MGANQSQETPKTSRNITFEEPEENGWVIVSRPNGPIRKPKRSSGADRKVYTGVVLLSDGTAVRCSCDRNGVCLDRTMVDVGTRV